MRVVAAFGALSLLLYGASPASGVVIGEEALSSYHGAVSHDSDDEWWPHGRPLGGHGHKVHLQDLRKHKATASAGSSSQASSESSAESSVDNDPEARAQWRREQRRESRERGQQSVAPIPDSQKRAVNVAAILKQAATSNAEAARARERHLEDAFQKARENGMETVAGQAILPSERVDEKSETVSRKLMLMVAKPGYPRTLFTVNNRGRLGNHLFQWATALAFARELNARVVIREQRYKIADTPQMSKLKILLWPEEQFATLQNQENMCHMWDRRPFQLDSNHSLVGQWTLVGAEKGTHHTPIKADFGENHEWLDLITNAMKNTHTPTKCTKWELDGFWQHQMFFNKHINFIREVFWNNDTASQAANNLKYLLWEEGEADVVAIHMRLGDYVYTGRNMPLSYYVEAVQKVRESRRSKRLVCVIFSDDMDNALKQAGKLEGCDKRVPVPPTMSDAISFYMMGSTPNVIIADSSFSFWAARLSPFNPLVVAPDITKSGQQAKSQDDYEYLKETPGWFRVNSTTHGMAELEQMQSVKLGRSKRQYFTAVSNERLEAMEADMSISEWAF